ncbi:MAG TPA: M14 metallopeptidase family protein, partial [Vicinamibacterales bacterium]|nr:M14 metallopeptidase family protein [Vicinamibacterales bacterium]
MPAPRPRALTLAAALFTITAGLLAAQTSTQITTPKQFFGFNIGDDYQLATYTQFSEYVHKLEKQTNRMKLVEIGKTSEGRPQLMAIVTAPENFRKLDRYQEISGQLAHAEGLTDDQARALAKEGKSIVWIDGGLHATEVLGAAQLTEMIYQMVSRTDPETMRFLNDDIILFVHANPDGMELVSNWYMRNKDPQQRSTNGVPRLYNKYAGHDDNRDFYMSNLSETTNMTRIMFQEWFPQIVYNHHQTGPAGTVMFAPPFRDPFNYNFDPQVPVEIELVAAAMHSRFIVEGKPGVTNRKGSSYSTWFNGGLRTVTYFHNMIGLLTETIGNPTPITIPFLPSKQLPDSNLYFPIEPQAWHFRQSVEYSITADRAVLDVASRERENFLFSFYKMGKASIERGNRDSWTTTPHRIAAAQAALGGRAAAEGEADAGFNTGGGRGGGGGTQEQFKQLLRNPEQRDPRGFILPSDQPDFPTATKFINTLLKNGVTVHRATAAFTVAGRNYAAGSYVVKGAQAFRPHVMDMFEPQDHPDDIPYPGGPPTPPYDATGYTLAFQMGVKFDRIMDAFEGPFDKVSGLQKPAAGKVTGTATAGYLLLHAANDSFTAINRLLAAGEAVSWMKNGPAAGAFYVAGRGSTTATIDKIASELGLQIDGVTVQPAGDAMKLHKLRVGLADQYGGSMPSGWTRFIFEQFEIPYQVVFPKALDAGDLIGKYDVLVFPSGTIPAALVNAGGGRGGRGGGGRGGGGGGRGGLGVGADIPAEFQDQLGSITAQTLPQLRKFLEDGGTIVAVGQSAVLARALGLPVENHLVERSADGVDRPLPREKYYVPGAVLRIAVDNTHPAAQGAADHVDVFFDNNPVFTLGPDASMRGVRPLAWFDTAAPLRSGWAWGQGYLNGGVIAFDATIG